MDRGRGTALAVAAALIAACSSPTRLSREELLDPETCKDCHPAHYEEWASSMHAYAADDPVFLAFNRLGQEETAGELGDFCVNCHAPMAVREGATTDGLNLEELPQHLKGVTCFFCHTTSAVEGTHNNPLVLSGDLVMLGEFADPIESNAHESAYSPLLDRNDVTESSKLCGACHDIVLANGVHLERTYAEWLGSVFNKPLLEGGLSCGGCHMEGSDSVIADVEGVPLRRRKEHAWPGIDTALTAWPGDDIQVAGIERDLFAAVLPKLCYNPSGGGTVEYTLDNVFAGHALPSGAAADRRMWAEVVASIGGTPVLESGIVAADEPVATAAEMDLQLWQIRDFATDSNGEEAVFWQVESIDEQLLPPAVTNDMSDPRFNHSVQRDYSLGGAGMPDRIVAVAHIRAIGLDLLDALIADDRLDPAVRDRVRTITIEGTRLVWTPEAAGADLCVDPQSSAE